MTRVIFLFFFGIALTTLIDLGAPRQRAFAARRLADSLAWSRYMNLSAAKFVGEILTPCLSFRA